MSRSEHATLRNPRDPDDLDRKRRIKRLVAEERREIASAPELDADAVAIEIRERGPFVHYPASPDDIRAVIARIPDCARGIARIQLCLDHHDDEGSVDPFIGRLPFELMRGVYSGGVLGSYHPQESLIHVHGYVYDPSMGERAIVELYLRLRMLGTLAHELAHHQDRTLRVSRGRWRQDDDTEVEIYAEAMQYAWTRDYVVPYLEEAYPAEVFELRCWLDRHAGLALPLEMLAGDPRTTNGVDGQRLFFSVDSAFESLVNDVLDGHEPPGTWIDFARNLYFGMNYDEADAIIARVLAAHSGHEVALALRAEILTEQDRLDEAGAIIRAFVETGSREIKAWYAAGELARARGDWTSRLDAATRAIDLLEGSGPEYFDSLLDATRARIELGEWTIVERDLARLRREVESPYHTQVVQTLECLVLVRTRRYAEAFDLAQRAIVGLRFPAPELLAASYEAACHLHLPYEPPNLDRVLARVRTAGYLAWADHLATMTRP